MIKEARRNKIKSAQRRCHRAETVLGTARENLRNELIEAVKEGSSYAELAGVVGVSRQRIHQIVSDA